MADDRTWHDTSSETNPDLSSDESFDDDGSSSSNPFIQMQNTMMQNYPHIISALHQQQPPPPPKIKHKRRYCNREREAHAATIFTDYFSPTTVYFPEKFRRRFRMYRPLFYRLVEGVVEQDPYFQERPDATGRASLTRWQKCTAAMRMLAYGVSADAVDEYCRLGETTGNECLERFCDAVVSKFGPTYMRKANEDDIRQLLQINAARGFPGMLGSIDCMHWIWKNCPAGWKGQFQGRNKKATLVLEAVASQDTWIWHSFFGVSGKHNDLTIVQRSPVFDDLLNGVAPPVNFEVNGHQYNMGYYLTDGIYPKWATFVKSFNHPTTHKEAKYSSVQEACRKDVERAFGVLQARFAIIRNPALAHSKPLLGKIMNCCITMHNMIVEDERHTYKNYDAMIAEFEKDTAEFAPESVTDIPINRAESLVNSIDNYMRVRSDVRSKTTHDALQKDLMEHIFRRH